ncbi:hypothetical protein QAD02_010465 [Eretmocerus hayati]|uniref:Uncharacterized protein n=1 Tax=Eretmocerus hayati TaxID=131215 RepID=A0ACC2NTZ1_9HYME|nr:hypothetical protein QAD02_010465 [Eretmocerus hayati]
MSFQCTALSQKGCKEGTRSPLAEGLKAIGGEFSHGYVPRLIRGSHKPKDRSQFALIWFHGDSSEGEHLQIVNTDVLIIFDKRAHEPIAHYRVKGVVNKETKEVHCLLAQAIAVAESKQKLQIFWEDSESEIRFSRKRECGSGLMVEKRGQCAMKKSNGTEGAKQSRRIGFESKGGAGKVDGKSKIETKQTAELADEDLRIFKLVAHLKKAQGKIEKLENNLRNVVGDDAMRREISEKDETIAKLQKQMQDTLSNDALRSEISAKNEKTDKLQSDLQDAQNDYLGRISFLPRQFPLQREDKPSREIDTKRKVDFENLLRTGEQKGKPKKKGGQVAKPTQQPKTKKEARAKIEQRSETKHQQQQPESKEKCKRYNRIKSPAHDSDSSTSSVRVTSAKQGKTLTPKVCTARSQAIQKSITDCST